MVKNLAIFDIDGTLTQTTHVDDTCFVQSFIDELGIHDLDTDWSRYPTVCDSGITQHIFRTHFDRMPSATERVRLQHRFVSLLEQAYEREPHLFVEVPGAGAAIHELRQHPDWAVAIATGGWQASALFKLGKARIAVEGIPAAFADHGVTREVIVAAALVMARHTYQQHQFARIVCIGDGVWDVRTARQLNLEFIGVASGERETVLRAEGARAIIRDFSDFDQFRHMLEELDYGKSVVCSSAK
ncbi:MAG: HAD family hydrolase [Deltaproteobacteria bacterium]|nr:HAD family hydrolase [Deltaproteobacteria bacterium]